MAGAFELYWQSAIGRAVMETLDKMVLSPDHAISVQVQFDEFMSTGQPAQEQGLLQGTKHNATSLFCSTHSSLHCTYSKGIMLK
uniref:Uncharacterized protein n=1 Tax=Triticum urartu TaxID=4572 RepID=A0A8R7TDA5_TRIUA